MPLCPAPKRFDGVLTRSFLIRSLASSGISFKKNGKIREKNKKTNFQKNY